MNRQKTRVGVAFILILLVALGGILPFIVNSVIAPVPTDEQVPIKWAVVVMGGYNYYRSLTINAIQRIEKIMMGRGVPFDLFQDDVIVAPSDSPPSGRYSLQFASGMPKYQVIVMLFDFEPSDTSCVNQQYIYWAVGNGTNAVVFNRAVQAVPALLGLSISDVGFEWRGVIVSNVVAETFSDGIKEYVQGSSVTMGINLFMHTIIRNRSGMTVWVDKTWSGVSTVGMANTTYGNGQVWYLGYSLNEYAMDYAPARYATSWTGWGMDFWGHAMNFIFNSAEKMPVTIMPFKRWKGAWIIRIDTDAYRWRGDQLPPESVLQSGWVYDYQYCVLGYGRTMTTGDVSLVSGAPSGYAGVPSSRVMYADITGFLQTDLVNSKTYRAIVYNSTTSGGFDTIKLDFNENMNFADDVEYEMWQNMTYPTLQGKYYWCSIYPDSDQPRTINVAVWFTPMLMDNEAVNLPKWKQYGEQYGLSYNFHGWQHVRLEGGSSYAMWNGDTFLLNTTYIGEKYDASRYWMADKFGGTGYGFEEDKVVISHPFDSHPAEVDSVIDNLPWVLFQYDGQMYYIGFGQKSASSKYTLSSSHEEYFSGMDRFAPIEDIVKTLYPYISTFTHRLGYNTSLSFTPYTNSIKPANSREAYEFWINSKSMLQNTVSAYYKADKITLEFTADSALTDYVWKFPVQLNGKQLTSFYDNRSIGQVKHTDDNFVYVEFSRGQGAQKLEVTYGTPVPTVQVTVSAVSPPSSGTTTPTADVYDIPENSTFSITASPVAGYAFHHWELDGVSVGSDNSFSFNVGTSSHTISAFFQSLPTVTVTVADVSPLTSGITSPSAGQYQVVENSVFEISATSSTGYVFNHWELDGTDVGSSNPYSFNVSISNHTIAAFFNALPTVSVTVSEVSPVDSGTTDPTPGTYTELENSIFSITATPLAGYVFDHWELDGVSVSSQLSYSFNVFTSSHTISALFQKLESTPIDSCDSLQNWLPRYSVIDLDTNDFQEGTGAIRVSTTTTPPWSIYAFLQKPMNLSSYASLQLWVKVSDASRTLRLMIATNWNNYNTYTISGLSANTWTLVTINLSAPTSSTGTINFNSISFIRFDYEIRMTQGFFLIDGIQGIYT